MALADLTSRDAVVGAMAEFDTLGRDDFLQRYGFGRAREYVVVYDGKRYDTKAIVGAAHGHQHPSLGPLKSDDFSGGQATIGTLSALGFEVVQVDQNGAPSDRTGARLARFLELYPSAREEPFSGDHKAYETLQTTAAGLAERLATVLSQAKVKPSVGQGNWARVPWIAILDPRETDSTQHGTYPVILIPENVDGVYLTLAQGVTELKQRHNRRAAYAEMRRRANVLGPTLTSLLEHGFELDGDVQLGDSPLGRDYAASVIASKYVPAGAVANSPIEDDMIHLGAVYEELLARGALSFDEDVLGPQVLCIYVGQGASTNFETGGRQGWWDGARRRPGSSLYAPAISFYSGVGTRVEARELTAQPGKRVLSTTRSSDASKSLRHEPMRQSCQTNLRAKQAIPGSFGSRCSASTPRYHFAAVMRCLPPRVTPSGKAR